MTNEFEFITKYTVLVPPAKEYLVPVGFRLDKVQVDENGYRLADVVRASPEQDRLVAVEWPRYLVDAPHPFVGRQDRDCEFCGESDRHPRHDAGFISSHDYQRDHGSENQCTYIVRDGADARECGEPAFRHK